MPHIFVPPPSSWSFELPPRLRLFIGDSISIFSRIDHLVVEILWVNEDADLARKRAIAKRSASDNIEALRKIVETLPVETGNIWGAFERLRNDRNIIGHSVWMLDDKYVPWAVWHSKFLESDEYVVGEQFSYERFQEMLRIATHLLETLLKFRMLLEKAAATRDAATKSSEKS